MCVFKGYYYAKGGNSTHGHTQTVNVSKRDTGVEVAIYHIHWVTVFSVLLHHTKSYEMKASWMRTKSCMQNIFFKEREVAYITLKIQILLSK